MGVTLYTKPGCPKCDMMKKKLTQKGIEFTVVDDVNETVKIGREHKIMSAPILKVNNAVFDLKVANDWVNDFNGTLPEEEPKCEEECKF